MGWFQLVGARAPALAEAKTRIHSGGSWWVVALGLSAVVGAGCNALLNIDEVEFGDTTSSGATAGTGGVGAQGGSGAAAGNGGGGGDGGQGGAAATCTDGVHNGQEEGVDCGGPDCPACAEDCLNGIDDDGDQLVDCADPLCAGFTCAPAAEAPWTGPAIFYTGSGPTPACPTDWPTTVTGGAGSFTASAASCTPCGCDSPSGASCGLASSVLYNAGNCGGSTVATVTPTAENACEPLSYGSDDSSVGNAVPVTGGGCAPNGGVPTIPDVVWEGGLAALCSGAATGAGCSEAGSLCIRSPAGSFQSNYCIYAEGDLSCPEGSPYTERTVVLRNVVDTRDCADCSCGAPTGITCSATTTFYSDGGCATALAAQAHDGNCFPRAPAASMRYVVDSGPTGGSCSVSGGGQPTGTVTADTPATVCCMP